MKKTLFFIIALAFTSVANAQQIIGYYEGKPYTQVVQCYCNQVKLIGTTLYVVVSRETPKTLPGRVGDYARNRTEESIEGVINHQINTLLWKLQQRVMTY